MEATSKEPRPRGRRIWMAIGAALLAAGIAAWVWASTPPTKPARSASAPVATATVKRGTISATETWSGTLGFGSPFGVTALAEGTVTRLANQGERLKRGDELFRLNERPVVLLYGKVPMYRDLTLGASGIDVRQLEKNLAALGYGGFKVDDRYTSSTAAAVRAWQQDIAAAPTGTVARSDIVFLPSARQVDALRVAVGGHAVPGTPVLDLTGTQQIVSLQADLDDREIFEVDTAVTVVLPGGKEIRGTVDATTVVQPSGSGGGFEETMESESILEGEIALSRNAAAGLVGASVDVEVPIDERTDVLLVPVSALLALTEGGYGLEVVNEDGTTTIAAVQTGLFGGGEVEVEGDEIAEGTVVGVAGR